MRIAFITNLPSHFHTRTFETIAKHYDIDFFFFSDGSESWIEKNNVLKVGDYKGYYVKGIRLTSRIRINIDLIKRLLKGHYDVFIQSINGRFELPATYILARLLNKPFILWTNLWSHPNTMFHKISFPLIKYIYRYADSIVVYGYHVRDYLRSMGIDERKIFYSWNVTDNTLFNKNVSIQAIDKLKYMYKLHGRYTILYVGRFVPEKGLVYLLEAFKQLPLNIPVSLILIGRGVDEESLKCIITSEQLRNVFIVDYVPNEKLIEYYALADIFILPSITTDTFKEPWGIVLNEAMNQGCPVIATNAVGAAVGGLVQHGKNGLIVPERDSRALADAIIEIFSHQDKLQKMKEFTREEIKEWDENKSFAGFNSAIQFVQNKNDSKKKVDNNEIKKRLGKTL